MRGKIGSYLRLAISVALISLFLVSLDFDRGWPSLATSGWLFLGLAVLVVNLDRFVMSYKWNILLRVKKVGLPFSDVVRSYYIGTFWGIFLPTSVGGDVVRAWRASEKAGMPQDVISSIVLERVLGLAATFLVGLAGGAVFALVAMSGDWTIVAIVAGVFLSFLSLLLLSFSTSFYQWVDSRFRSHRRGWLEKLNEVYRSYQAYRHHRGSILQFFLWSVSEQGFPIVVAYLVSQALQIDAPVWSFLIFIPVIVALSRLPVSLHGFGVQEGLFVYCFSLAGLPAAEAFMLGFASHLVGVLAVLPGFFYCSFYAKSPAVAGS